MSEKNSEGRHFYSASTAAICIAFLPLLVSSKVIEISSFVAEPHKLEDTREEIITNYTTGDYAILSEEIEARMNSSEEVTSKTLNLRPIIGILSQGLSRGMRRVLQARPYKSYIAASYVKFLESAGARVVPVFIDQSDDYYRKMVASLNGFLFPGGGVDITTSGSFGRAGKKIFDLAVEAAARGNPVPIFGTCLGFEMLGLLVAGRMPLDVCKASNRADPLYFQVDPKESRMFADVPQRILKNLANKNITANFHRKCIFPQRFYELNMNESLVILSTSFDDLDFEYISTFEHKTLPIYGTQWHPEKAPYEWTLYKKHNNIPHQFDAIEAAQYMANFYVNEARKNHNKFPSVEEEQSSLIYNYNPVYVALLYNSSFQQCYFFP